jgi:hypothetical protein
LIGRRLHVRFAPITVSADQALAALNANRENKSDKSEAMEFLKDLLKAGPMAAKDVNKEACDAGISQKSLRTARQALGIKPQKSSMEGGWVWTPPEDALARRRCP